MAILILALRFPSASLLLSRSFMNALWMRAMSTDLTSMESSLAIRLESTTSSSVVTLRSGIIMPMTLLPPRASTQRQAVTAESMPPLIATTTPSA